MRQLIPCFRVHACLVLALAMIMLHVSGSEAAPRGVRLTWFDDPASTMAVSWNADEATADQIIFGTQPDNLASALTAQQHFVQAAPLNHAFTASLTGLTPNTIYYYRVGEVTGYRPPLAEAPYSFKTFSNDPCQPFTFVLIGDNRADFDDIGPSPLWSGILEEALAHDPDFFVNTGDMVKNGDNAVEWSAFIDMSEPGWAYVPSLLTLGNHDEHADNGPTALYSQIFELPRNSSNGWENYYGLDVGPIRFFSLDSNSSGAPFDAMTSWLGGDLAATLPDWRIGFFHHAIYSRGNHSTGEISNGFLNANLIPLFDAYDVDFVFNGHSHNYERYAPTVGVDPEFGGGGRSFPNGNGFANGPGTTLPDGRTGTNYIVSGGAGALTTEIGGFACIDAACTFCTGFNINCDPDVFARDQEGNAVYEGKHNYAVFQVNGEQIDVEVWTTVTGNVGGGSMVDHFTMINDTPCIAVDVDVPTPVRTQLHQNRPNPFNPATSIRFALAEDVHVRLTIYDMAGRRVRQLVNEFMSADEHGRIWDGRDDRGSRVVSGVYSYKLEAGTHVETKRMVIVR